MAHTPREKYSELVLAKLRASLVLEDGVVFNNDYEGDPVSGSVKIPVRDDEVAVSDYDKANGISLTHGSTTYTTLLIDKDKAVNELIDGFDAVSVPGKLVADRLDSAGYALARQMDTDGATTLLAGATVKNVEQLTAQNIYSTIVDIRTDMSTANIPDDGRRYLLATPAVIALLLKCPEFVRATQLGDSTVTNGTVGKIAGFKVKEWNDSTANLAMIAGHPKYATRAKACSCAGSGWFRHVYRRVRCTGQKGIRPQGTASGCHSCGLCARYADHHPRGIRFRQDHCDRDRRQHLCLQAQSVQPCDL